VPCRWEEKRKEKREKCWKKERKAGTAAALQSAVPHVQFNALLWNIPSSTQ